MHPGLVSVPLARVCPLSSHTRCQSWFASRHHILYRCRLHCCATLTVRSGVDLRSSLSRTLMIRRAIVTVLCAFTVVREPRWASGFLSSPARINRSNVVRSSTSNGVSGRMVSQTVMLTSSSDVHINKDIVVIGGGLAGLSTALELAKRGRQVTVLSRSHSEAAAEAAGGMIAPQAERLESGTYLDLCLASRAMYSDWVSSIESIAGLGGDRAETHFWSSGGFLAPAFEGDAVHTWRPPAEGGQAHWIDKEQVHHSGPIHSMLRCWCRQSSICICQVHHVQYSRSLY